MTNPALIEANMSRAHQLLMRGMWEAAAAACDELLQLAPNDARTWHYGGRFWLQQQRFAEAETALRHAATLAPDDAIVWDLLSIACYAQSKWQETAVSCERALALAPGEAITWTRLAAAHRALGQWRPAEDALQEASRLAPANAEILTDYGHLLCDTQRPDQALEVLGRVTRLEPGHARALVGTAKAEGLLGRWDAAAAACQAAFAADSSNRDARMLLAIARLRLWELSDAEAIIVQLLEEFPLDAGYWGLRGNVLHKAGRSEEAVSAFRRSVELESSATIHGTLLLALQYVDGQSPQELLQAHREWDVRYAQPLLPRDPIQPQPAAGRKLRIGFVSRDFAQHPTGFLALPAIEALNRAEFSAICYCDKLGEDEYTERFRRAADAWRMTASLLDEELAERIRADQIDILFDLMGHTGQRLLAFARRPAPLQIAWLGYASTTGVAAIDCLLADRFHVGDGEEVNFSERVLRMPDGYACYGPPEDAPSVQPLPALARGRVTFGCFNNTAKFTPRMLAAWAEILHRTPDSQLLLKAGGLDLQECQTRLQGFFADRGIREDRIILAGRSPHRELLEAYHRVDLALDTQPYSGGLTTCEALWMGVPVITYPGRTFAGRHTVSHLTTAGYGQFVAADLEGYIDLVVDWANRLDELAIFRRSMRDQVRRSPLCDARRFAENFADALRQAWTTRCPVID